MASLEDTRALKAADAFRTISEVADDLDVPQHVLRFWETRFSQIRPMKRAGGRRYYRPADVDLLKGIRHLLYGEGYTIRGVQRILKEEGVQHLVAIGRGEAYAEKPAVLDNEPKSVVVAPRISKIVKVENLAAKMPRKEPTFAPAVPEVDDSLSAEQDRLLREALADLAAARALLGVA
jgi:DNA-binding transcriptional MerR regulator